MTHGPGSRRADPAGRPAGGRLTPMWLAHHWPDEYDRCVLVGRTHVCRRCLVLYPLAVAVMVLSLGATPGVAIELIALVLLPLPAVAEFVLEQVGRIRYSPRRVVLVTIPLAVGLGRGFARYLSHFGDPLFWAVVVFYGGVCFASVVWARRSVDR